MGIEREDAQTIRPYLRGRQGRLLILGDAVVHFGGHDAYSLGRELGFEKTDTLDLAGSPTIRHDLHEPAPEHLAAAFDAVIDAGTVFFCSDPGAALRTTLSFAKSGGLIAHISGVTGYFGQNRGYYNIHPQLFADFYAVNGCEQLGMTLRSKFRPRWLNRLGRRVDLATWPVLPNNMVGVFVFERGRIADPRMPVPS